MDPGALKKLAGRLSRKICQKQTTHKTNNICSTNHGHSHHPPCRGLNNEHFLDMLCSTDPIPVHNSTTRIVNNKSSILVRIGNQYVTFGHCLLFISCILISIGIIIIIVIDISVVIDFNITQWIKVNQHYPSTKYLHCHVGE